VVKRSGETRNYACIGGTFTFTKYRRQGLAAKLIGFLINELLQERPAIHLIVDDDNFAAINLGDFLEIMYPLENLKRFSRTYHVNTP